MIDAVSDAACARALARLQGLARFGMRPGLAATAHLLAALGDPQRRLPALHIAGTNGKGSTAAIAESLLREQGARVGLYTSPHLLRFSERIQIDRVEIAPSRLAGLIDRVLDAPGGDGVTLFEAATAVALLYFAEERVDLAVIEVGLGGRLDATSLCRPFASVITNIALDHTAELGPTTREIAGEKAGIARPAVPLVVGTVDPAARSVIAEQAARVGTRPLWLGREVEVALHEAGFDYRGPGGSLDGAAVGLVGAHQVRNAALALAAASFAPGFAPAEAARRRGLASARWPGRFERLATDLWVDGAHNPDGAEALRGALREAGLGEVTLLVGLLADKDVDGVIDQLVPAASRVVCTEPPSPRALPAATLAARVGSRFPNLPVLAEPDLATALERARRGGPVVACGSLYLVGAIRGIALGDPPDPLSWGRF